MGYSPRQFHSGKVYELTIRTLSGLPFVCSKLITFLLKLALARANRDGKVSICHFVWMGNHAHILLVCRDQQGLANFVCELKKKLTDYLKRLFGLEQLFLWERRSSIAEIATYEDLVERLQYFYLNPQSAGLTNDIESYPGLTTWEAFQLSECDLEATIESSIPWISTSCLPRIPKKYDRMWDSRITRSLAKSSQSMELLTIEPYACLRSFGRSSSDTAAFKAEIVEGVKKRQKLLRTKRHKEGKKVFGAVALQRQRPTLKGWKPKEKDRRIFLICNNTDLRLKILRKYKNFQQLCRECYQDYLAGYKQVEWPPGAFQPPLPRLYNWLDRQAQPG